MGGGGGGWGGGPRNFTEVLTAAPGAALVPDISGGGRIEHEWGACTSRPDVQKAAFSGIWDSTLPSKTASVDVIAYRYKVTAPVDGEIADSGTLLAPTIPLPPTTPPANTLMLWIWIPVCVVLLRPLVLERDVCDTPLIRNPPPEARPRLSSVYGDPWNIGHRVVGGVGEGLHNVTPP